MQYVSLADKVTRDLTHSLCQFLVFFFFLFVTKASAEDIWQPAFFLISREPWQQQPLYINLSFQLSTYRGWPSDLIPLNVFFSFT